MSPRKAEQKPPRWTEYLALDDVLRAPRNPKNHNAQVIAGSMKRFGVVEQPALDERTGRLVAGHGRLDEWQRARAAGEQPPDGVIVGDDGGWLVPIGRGWSSADDDEAESYLITSNNSVIMGGWDEQGLEEMLADIARHDFGLAQVTGASAADLEAILDAQQDAVDSALAAIAQAEPQGTGDHEARHPDPDAPPQERLDGPAPWAPAYDPDPVIEHDSVPATGARYAETPEQQAVREQRIAAYQPRQGANTGLVEMILVYPIDDRNEVARLVAAAREILGRDLKGSEIVLRAMRTLLAVLDNRNAPRPIDMSLLSSAAGWTDDGDG